MIAVGGHQLHVFPGIEYLARMSICDAWVYADDVKFNRHDWQNRNRIKSPFGWQFITIPVVEAETEELIREKKISYARKGWPEKLWQTLEQTYGNQPHWSDLRWLQDLLLSQPPLLVSLIEPILTWLVSYLELKPRIYYASQLPTEGATVSERLAFRTKALGGDTYVTGPQGWNYLERAPFEANGLQIRGFVWACPVYPQRWNRDGFVPDLSCLDLIASQGRAAAALLRQGIRISESQGGLL